MIDRDNYSFLATSKQSESLVVFVPGMACARFGAPNPEEKAGVVRDIIETCTALDHAALFPDVHSFEDSSERHEGKTVEDQVEVTTDSLERSRVHMSPERILFIGQSLGTLAIANFIDLSRPSEIETSAMFLAPPTYEGAYNHAQLVKMFEKNPRTKVDEKQCGQLEFGDKQLLLVTEQYWNSIDKNALSNHTQTLKRHLAKLAILYATEDKYYPDSTAYIDTHLPWASAFPIAGKSHAFKTAEMRQQFKDNLRTFIVNSE